MSEAQFWIGVHAVIEAHGRILVLKRASTMNYRPASWDLPGGHLSLGEAVEQCLLREVNEETGLDVVIVRMLGFNHAGGPYIQVLYACSVVEAKCEIRLLPWEHAEARWVTLKELCAMSPLIPYLEMVVERGMLDYLERER
ncbi:MAG: NUDIX domain-containing protein [Candidatus Binataceae bacterium]